MFAYDSLQRCDASYSSKHATVFRSETDVWRAINQPRFTRRDTQHLVTRRRHHFVASETYAEEMDAHVSRMLESDYRWTEDRCIQLIRKFRSKSILWDTKSPLFYRQHTKKKVWDNIGRELNTTGADCKHKMSILLSSFRREKAKLKNSLSTGATPVYQSSWFAFNDLVFLINRNSQESMSEPNEDSGADVTTETSTNNEETYNVTEDDSIDYMKNEPVSDDDEEFEGELRIGPTESVSPIPTRHNITESEAVQYALPENSSQNMHKGKNVQKKTIKQTDTNRLEEIVTFTNFIQAKMKKYTSQTLNTVQKEICDVIFKADLNYDNNMVSNEDVRKNSSKKRKLSETLPK